MIRIATSELRDIKEKTRCALHALDKNDVTHRETEESVAQRTALRELLVALETFLNSCAVQ